MLKKIILIHDIAGLRMGEKEILEKEIEVFKCFDYVIVHNKVMKRFLENNGMEVTLSILFVIVFIINICTLVFYIHQKKTRKEED